MFSTEAQERGWVLTPRWKAFLVTGALFLLAAIGTAILDVKVRERASNPPSGWIATTTPDVWLPPNPHLKPSFTDGPQIGEFWEDYVELAEAGGSYNVIVVSGKFGGLLLTYVTYPEVEAGIHTAQRKYEEKLGDLYGRYDLIEGGESRPRIEDGKLVLHWRYQGSATPLVLLLLVLLALAGVVLFWTFEPLLERLFQRRALRG